MGQFHSEMITRRFFHILSNITGELKRWYFDPRVIY